MQVSFSKQSANLAPQVKVPHRASFHLPANTLQGLPHDTVSLSFSGSTDPKPAPPKHEPPSTTPATKTTARRNLKKLALGVVLTATGVGLAVASLPITALLAASGLGLPATPVTVGIGFIGGGLALLGGNTMLKGLSGKSYGALFQRFLNELMSRDSVQEPVKEPAQKTDKEPAKKKRTNSTEPFVEDPPVNNNPTSNSPPASVEEPKPPVTKTPNKPNDTEQGKQNDTDTPSDINTNTPPKTETPKDEEPLADASKLNKDELFTLLTEHDELKTLTESLTATQKQFVQHMHKDDSFHLKTDHEVNIAIKELRRHISTFGKTIGYKSLSQRIYDYVESAVERESSELNTKKELSLSGNVKLLREWHTQLNETYPNFFKRPKSLLNYINQNVTPYYTNIDDLTSVHQNVDETLIVLAQNKIDAFLSSQEQEAAAKKEAQQTETDDTTRLSTDESATLDTNSPSENNHSDLPPQF